MRGRIAAVGTLNCHLNRPMTPYNMDVWEEQVRNPSESIATICCDKDSPWILRVARIVEEIESLAMAQVFYAIFSVGYVVNPVHKKETGSGAVVADFRLWEKLDCVAQPLTATSGQ